MNERELENLGEKVRVQGGQGSGTMSELVFDPVTGEFRTIEPGEDVSDDEMNVTEMTDEGFAM